MSKTKEQLEQLILQEYKSYFTEQQEDPRAALKVNASQQIRMLRFMKEVLKKVTISPEVEKMAEQLKKAKTAEFLTQVLGVDKSIPINLSSALESPVALIQAVIDEVISVAINKARQKLAENLQEGEELDEGDLPFLARDAARQDKRDKKKKKKEGIPPPNLKEGDTSKQIKILTKQVIKLTDLAGKRRDTGRVEAAEQAMAQARMLQAKVAELKKQAGMPNVALEESENEQ